MTHFDFVSPKETFSRLDSLLNPLSKGFSFIIRQGMHETPRFCSEGQKGRLGVIRTERKKFKNKTKRRKPKICSKT